MMKDSYSKPFIVYSIDNYLDVTANWLYQQMSAIKKFTPVVVSRTKSNEAIFPHEHIHSLQDLSFLNIFLNKLERRIFFNNSLRFHRSTIKKYSPVLMHSHFGPRVYCDLEVSKKLNIPLIGSFYGMDATMIPSQDFSWRRKYLEVFSQVDLLVVEANNMSKLLIDLGCPRDKIIINRLGVDLKSVFFRPRQKTSLLKFLIASSFREKKGIPDALEAIGRIKNKLPSFSITIIGESSGSIDSEVELNKIISTISKYGLNDKVSFIGYLSRLELISQAYKHDIYISTSKTAKNGDSEGGTNITLLEMGATGMPIVTTNHCDLPTTLGERNQRWVSQEGSIDSIISSIEGIIEDDWVELGSSNRNHVENNFNVEICVEKLEKIYKDVAKKS